MRRSAWALGLAIGASLSPACSSSPATSTGAVASASSTTASSTAASTSSSSTGTGGAGGAGTTASGTGGTSPNDLCMETGHAGACRMCCASDNAEGDTTYVTALIQYCACTVGATCYAQCSDTGDLCSNVSAQTGSTACIDCVDGVAKTDPCFTATTNSVNTTCNADPSCAALVVCDQVCTSLPM